MELESLILKSIHDGGAVEDTADLAKAAGVDHLAVIGLMKSLEAAEMVAVEVRKTQRWNT